jgi:beta-barrel assembly-enhancing protease
MTGTTSLSRRQVLLVSMGLCAGCASTGSLAPVTSATYDQAEDEKRMWGQVADAQKELDRSGVLYADPELETYLNGVARRLVEPGLLKAIPFRIRVIENPKLNAFALPNGGIYVHTGMLARFENEAQIATVLGHEMTHATHRHALKEHRDRKSKSAAMAVLSLTFGSVPFVGPLATMFGHLGTTAAMTGYSRDLEREADAVGLALAVKAGYDPTEAPKVFEELKREVEAEKVKEPFFYSTHPRLAERIDTYRALLSREYRDAKGGATNQKVFLERTAGVVLETSRQELKAGRFGIAQRAAAKYAAIRPRDARGPFTLAEVARQRGEEGDPQRAVAHYQKAIALDADYAEPNRGLGLVHFKLGDKKTAKRYLETYLQLEPRAADRAYVQETIRLCAQ